MTRQSVEHAGDQVQAAGWRDLATRLNDELEDVGGLVPADARGFADAVTCLSNGRPREARVALSRVTSRGGRHSRIAARYVSRIDHLTRVVVEPGSRRLLFGLCSVIGATIGTWSVWRLISSRKRKAVDVRGQLGERYLRHRDSGRVDLESARTRHRVESSPGRERQVGSGRSRSGRSATETAAAESDTGAVLTRTPHMDVRGPEHPAPDDLIGVDVYADTLPARSGERSHQLHIPLPPGVVEVPVDVWLTASPPLVVLEKPVKRIVIRQDVERSTTASFRLRVEQGATGLATIVAHFSSEGRPCGRVSREVSLGASQPPDRVVATADEVEGPPDGFEAHLGASEADLTVHVTHVSGDDYERAFHCRVTSPHLSAAELPPPEKWVLPARSGDLIAAYTRDYMDRTASPVARIKSIEGAGLTLFDDAPESFKEVFWKLVDRGTVLRSMYVCSQEPYIPWELMIPSRRDQQLQPLGVMLAIGRWISRKDVSPPQSLTLRSSWVIAPTYQGIPDPLPQAPAEAQLVCQSLSGSLLTPVDLQTIDERLGTEPRTLVHFICHGEKGEHGIQTIYVDGTAQRLTHLQIRAMAGVRKQCGAKPVIFLNACEVGQPVPTLRGLGGFAKLFMDFGAGAVIAPLWSVKDVHAHEVARQFYSELQAKPTEPYARILQRIRARAYESGHDTYAAYCFYGDPNAHA